MSVTSCHNGVESGPTYWTGDAGFTESKTVANRNPQHGEENIKAKKVTKVRWDYLYTERVIRIMDKSREMTHS